MTINIPKQGKKGNKEIESGLQRIVMPLEYHPGSIQEAQNCVAIVALMKFFPDLKLDFTFQQPYRDVLIQLQKHSWNFGLILII